MIAISAKLRAVLGKLYSTNWWIPFQAETTQIRGCPQEAQSPRSGGTDPRTMTTG